ncbi:hypothetical protein CIW53_16655 [Rhodanobacter sp. T12-5]|nr:hypothetical protein CIW53_16655 [Rhodanobacter sp. T12-5]
MQVAAEPAKSREAQIAGVATAASVPAAMVITQFSKGLISDVSLGDVISSLSEHAGKIKGGDLGRIEAMLGGQAAALNTMFAELARRGAVNMGEYIGAAETYLKLALRAQSQCRATLETLAAIKSPPVVFAKQANIAHGPQQVNNDSAAIARAEEIENQPSKLMEHDHGQRLDTGTAAAASGSNQAMEAVGAIQRPANGRRKGSVKPQCMEGRT